MYYSTVSCSLTWKYDVGPRFTLSLFSIKVQDGNLWYSSKLGENFPVNMTLTNDNYGLVRVSDGVWHNLTLLLSPQSLTFQLDSRPVGDELDPNTIHNFLDPYLTSLTFGGTPDPVLLGTEADTSERLLAPVFPPCVCIFPISNYYFVVRQASKDACLPSSWTGKFKP